MSRTTQIHTAMIMAAGLGKRMAPLTDKIPKPMIEFAGRPMIDHVLDRLQEAGVEKAVVNVHYHADQIERHVMQRTTPKIVISDERAALLETGGGVKKARCLLGDEPVITFNSDSIWIEGRGHNLRRLMDRWDPEKMDALLMLAPAVSTLGEVRRGDFTMDQDGKLTRRQECSVAPFMFAGVQIVKPALFDTGPTGPFSTNLIWDRIIEQDRLYGWRMDGMWMHIGTPGDLADAEKFLQDLY